MNQRQFGGRFGAFALTLAMLSGAAGCSMFQPKEKHAALARAPRQFQGEERPARADGRGIRAALNLQPQLRLPVKIAVYLQPVAAENRRLSWSPEDKEQIADWEARLRRAGIASDLFLMSEIVVDDVTNSTSEEALKQSQAMSIPRLRLAAAKHGASALLVIRGSRVLDEYFNPLAALYLTIVGYFIVPGSHADATVTLDGALFNVANEYLYVSLDAEGKGESFGPGAILEGDRATADAKREALTLFGNALFDRMERLR